MESELYLDSPIHFQKIRSLGFNLEAEEHQAIRENLITSIDGSIMGVKTECVLPFLQDPEVRKFRYGLIKKSKVEIDVKDADSFYRLLAMCIPLSEY